MVVRYGSLHGGGRGVPGGVGGGIYTRRGTLHIHQEGYLASYLHTRRVPSLIPAYQGGYTPCIYPPGRLHTLYIHHLGMYTGYATHLGMYTGYATHLGYTSGRRTPTRVYLREKDTYPGYTSVLRERDGQLCA